MHDSTNTKMFPYQLARMGWVAGIIAIVLVGLTARGSARVTGELIAFVFMGVGTLASVVSLATITKFGTKGLLWPGLAGIAINGLLLSIAVPNFLHARERVIEQRKSTERQSVTLPEQRQLPVAKLEERNAKQTTPWQRYQVAGLEIAAPFALTNVDALASLKRIQTTMRLSSEQIAAAEENARRLEAYSGAKGGLALSLNGRVLPPGENVAIENIEAQITGTLQSKFPEGFHSEHRTAMIAGREATRLTIHCRIQSKTAKAEQFIILGQSNLWQIQFFGPADLPKYDETVEKVLGSVNFLSGEIKPTP